MVPLSSSIAQVMGVTNAVTVDADAVNELTLVGPGAGGTGDRLGRGRRYRRYRARHPLGAVRPAGGCIWRRPRNRRCSATRAAITSGSRRATISARRRPSPRAWPNAASRWKASSSVAAAPPTTDVVPVVLVTYATTEASVREALAAIVADGHIAEKPQVIRIERE